MKLYLLFFIIGTLQVSATVYSQNEKLNVKVKDVALSELLWQLQENSEFVFVYKTNDLIDAEKVSLSKIDASLAEILDEALADSNLTYELDNGVVVIKQKPPVKVKTIESEMVQPQKIKVSGTVKDDEGEPIPFAALRIKGTDRGTVTDINGHFELEMDEIEGVVLEISSIGFKNVELDLNGKTDHKVILKADNVGLDEVVAIGYGTASKRDLTGSVASISKAKIASTTAGNGVETALRGTAGVNVLSGSGQPGAPVRVQIRGITSLSGDTEPLYIVDGVRMPTNVSYAKGPSSSLSGEGKIEDQLNALLNINMSDVESIEVLKDASSCAIYGSRASNGVVIIKTKKGTAGMDTKLTFESNLAIDSRADNVTMMNTEEYVDFFERTVAYTEAQGIGVDDKYKAEDLYRTDINTNWIDKVSQQAIRQDYRLSIIGGSTKGGYYGSVSYLKHDGLIIGSELSTLSGMFKFDNQIGEHIKFDMNINVSNSVNKKGNGSVIGAVRYRPNAPVYDENEDFYRNPEESENPVAKTYIKNDFENMSIQGSFGLEVNLTPYLRFTTRPSMRYGFGTQSSYYPSFTYQGGLQNGEQKFSGYVAESYNKSTIVEITNLLAFNKSFGKHNITTLLGQSYDESKSYTLASDANNVADDFVASNIGTASKLLSTSDGRSESALLSYFFRNEYNYAHKYYLNLSVRRDGSSRFGADRRFGYFPSVGVAWTLSEERFYKNLGLPDVMDFVKFRASYGQVGNQNLGDGLQYTSLAGSSYGEEAAFYLSTLGNASLQWERTSEYDFGAEFVFLDNLFHVSAGYYIKETDNLLYRADVAPSLPLSFYGIYKNIAEVENKGLELDFAANIINKNDMTWRLGFNISQNRQMVKKLSTDDEMEIQGYTVMEPGHTIGTFYGLVSDGLIQTQDEIDDLNATAYLMSGGKTDYYMGQFKGPGDIKFKDLNKDGVINNDDRTYLGSPAPDFFGGFDGLFRWKNISLSAYFSYAVGGKKMWAFEQEATQIYGYSNKPKSIIEDTWSEDNRDAHYPRLLVGSGGNNSSFSDFYLHDASYVRLDNLRLEYNISNPGEFLRKVNINSLQLSANITNLFTITDYPGFDPTFAGSRSAYGMGIDNSNYPPVKTFMMGLKVAF